MYTVEYAGHDMWYPLASGIKDENRAYELFYAYAKDRKTPIRLVLDGQWVVAQLN